MSETAKDIATGPLVKFVHELDEATLPTAARHECLRALLDAIGCAIGGARHEIVERAYGALREFAGPATTSLLGRAERTDPLHAALINGLAGAAYSFFDTYSDALLHPGGPIAVALLAVAERKRVSGTEFLTAFAAGTEVACRLTKMAVLPPAEGNISWSQSGVVDGLAAALAAGRLLRLRPDQLRWAVGIAASEAAGTRVEHGSMAASLIFGRAAQGGLRAALLAEMEFTSSPRPIEDRHGFASVYSSKPNFGALVDGLGSHFELLRNTYKPFPTGVVAHPAIDVMLRLKKEHPFQGGDVRRIELHVTQNAVTFGFRPQPANDLEAKFSIHHWAAAAAMFGKAGIQEGALAVVMNPEIVRLRSVIRMEADTSLPPYGARLAVELADGRRLEAAVAHCVGSPEAPMSDEALETKFVDQCEPVIGRPRAEALAAMCWRIGDLEDAAELARAAC